MIGDKFGKSNKFYYISIMTKYKPSRKLTKADGTIAYTFDNKAS
jgi:hypothetical protein